MRVYLLVSAALYGAVGMLLLTRPLEWYPVNGHGLVAVDHLALWYGLLFLIVCGVKVAAGWRLTPNWQLAGVVAGVTASAFWCCVTFIGAVLFGGSLGYPIWVAYVCWLTVLIIPYARGTEAERRAITAYRQRLRRRVYEVAEQTNTPPLPESEQP